MRCRLCDSNRLLSVLDLGATPPCEKFLTADELDLPEPRFRSTFGSVRTACYCRSPR